MKKLVTAFALCAAMSTMAQVNSQNIVGYVTKSTTANTLDMMGVNFQNPETTTLSIQLIIPQSGFSIEGADVLRMWNPLTQGYASYFYFGVTYVDDTYAVEAGPGWADAAQIRVLSSVKLDPGQGFWIKTRSAATFTIAGEIVQPTDNKVSTLANTLDMMAGTFPVSMSIQDAVPFSGFSIEGADVMRVWNPLTQGYSTYFYFGETYLDDTYATALGAGWADAAQIRANVTIAQGQGFWLKTRAAAVLSFTSPY